MSHRKEQVAGSLRRIRTKPRYLVRMRRRLVAGGIGLEVLALSLCTVFLMSVIAGSLCSKIT